MDKIMRGILIVKVYKREGVLLTEENSPVRTKTNTSWRSHPHDLQTKAIWQPFLYLHHLVFWKLRISSSGTPCFRMNPAPQQWCTWYGTDNLVTPTHTKNSTSFPSNQDRNLFPLIHRNNKSYGTVNAYHLKWKVKIRNKLLDIWNWETDLQSITGINNTCKIP